MSDGLDLTPDSSVAPSAALRGIYLFCVTTARAPGLPMEALDGTVTMSIVEPGRSGQPDLVAITCPVDLIDWQGARGEAQLKDVAWLGPRAIRHEQIIEQVIASGPVLPLRFGCIFSGEARLRSWLGQHQATLRAFLRDITNFGEWSIKGWLSPARAVSALAKESDSDGGKPESPGARYLREQQQKQALGRRARDWARAEAASIVESLAPHTARVRALGYLPGSASGREEEVAFHCALLCPSTQVAALQQAVDALNKSYAPRGLQLALSGPWPPYSFCPRLDEPAAPPSPQTVPLAGSELA